MFHRQRRAIHSPGLWQRLLGAVRGRRQRLVRTTDRSPFLLISFPAQAGEVADELATAYAHILPALSAELRQRYQALWEKLPPLVIVQLRPRNLCGCLGHHHPRGSESRLARRLQDELSSPVGEIDLAYESIREWRPQPLSSLAASHLGDRLAEIQLQAGLLAVMLHELDHLANPDRPEKQVRSTSDAFYSELMQELIREEAGANYGMSPPAADD
jgi:hypothetical protein